VIECEKTIISEHRIAHNVTYMTQQATFFDLSTTEEAQAIVDALTLNGRHDPHHLLGIQPTPSGGRVIRVFRPGAAQMHIEVMGYIHEMHLVHSSGLFEFPIAPDVKPLDYRVFHTSGLLAHDPYVFWPTLGEMDLYLFGQGTHYELHNRFGGRLMNHQGVPGVSFAVWAPSAKAVSLVGDVNHWDGRTLPMRSLGSSGVWELFVPGLDAGAMYKFEVITATGQRLIKTDPLGLWFEMRPKTSAIVADPNQYHWKDSSWMEHRKTHSLNTPMAIYEVHLGSWKRHNGAFPNYRELGNELAEYCTKMGFTHVELMPVAEHPLDESWGYQITGYFAPTSRFGTVEDFQYFVDVLHKHSIGVILDWVPGHFPTDDFALARFDGTALYEHEDPRQGFHPHWNTFIFNFGRHEVKNFLISSALSWLDLFHIDGLRVDAVASMLYLDYGREHGQWIPNQWGGKENVDAIEFLRHANSVIHERFPGVITIAEESTSFSSITHPLANGGLGFDFKWNMGWMNDTLRYIQKEPIHRSYHQNELTFGLLYAFSEKFISVLSHDEVVHGKRSLLSKMPGDIWQKFANLRLLYSYMICQPGKKLLFMGGEVGQWDEWWCGAEVQWFLLNFPYHQGLQDCFRDLNHFYQKNEPLYADDMSFHGFEWVDFSDQSNSVISYFRKVPNSPKALFCIHNFTPTYYEKYGVPVHGVRKLTEVFNTDDMRYGGSGRVHGPVYCHADRHEKFVRVDIALPPLATTIYEVEWQ
jgi:1,4-alpha-glucan branching enzyme